MYTFIMLEKKKFILLEKIEEKNCINNRMSIVSKQNVFASSGCTENSINFKTDM